MSLVWRIIPCPFLAGDLEPTEGEARRSHALRVGRYAQHFVDALKFDTNPVEYLLSKYPKVREATGHNLYVLHCLAGLAFILF